ncbi:hypothetical protein FNV43_RR00832 [Rhamnella rubrinervis]|uniref:ADP-ribosyl cyclase/cyclic ADP-ribose hydrolase n=1 Tax=Rhamnella rubrinervis TaxID=2594499 RepID=A0A8K0HNI9_9ROSA|nr:hypothetical protein FNV43_RR00832 [Rhamnella rubrinervis]
MKDPFYKIHILFLTHCLLLLVSMNEAMFIEDLIKVVSGKIFDAALLNISKDLVGMDSRLEKLKLCVSESPFGDIRFIGICGLGGVGKTTFARAYFENMSCQFQASSFLANIREACEKEHDDGLVRFQKQLLTDILKGEHKINNVSEGKGLISRRFCRKKILVVLDDVDQLDQLKGLADDSNWFGYGSQIIVTTRDESLLPRQYEKEEYIIHKVDELEDSEALQLFSSKAFKRDCPPQDYTELSVKVIKYASGLPLALVVLGSFLRGKTRDQWKSALDRLKEYPDKEIMSVLRISFDGLEETEKNIFLDIACFFNGFRKDEVMNIMDCCGFYPEIGIGSLVDKSLLYMDHDGNRLRMHDLLEEMGKEIVREESRNEPGRRSRIWLNDDFFHVMNNETGREEVEAIVCRHSKPDNLGGFSNMKKLRLLIIGLPWLNGDEWPNNVYLSNELRFLDWSGFPFHSFPPSFQPHGLVNLKLWNSKIKQLWNNPLKPLCNVKSIDLSNSTGIRKLEGFSLVPNLEELILDSCRNLDWIDPSITVLKRLTLLSLEGLKSLPTSMDGLYCLEKLNLRGCHLDDGAFTDDFGCLVSLEYLDLSRNNFSCLPAGFNRLSKLRHLNLRNCSNLTSLGPELPDSLENVKVDYCSKLHTFLDPLSQCNLRCSTIFAGTALNWQRGKAAKGQQLHHLEDIFSPSKRFDIFLPGDEIPSWFTHQVRGSSSISLPLHENWCNNEWKGFALSVCFSTKVAQFCNGLLWQIKINQEDWGFGHVRHQSVDGIYNFHLWLLYLPRDTYFHPEWQDKFGHIQFSLETSEEREVNHYKQCGVRLVYEQDIEELNLAATHELM